MKKRYKIWLTLALTLALLSGCGNEASNIETTSTESPTAEVHQEDSVSVVEETDQNDVETEESNQNNEASEVGESEQTDNLNENKDYSHLVAYVDMAIGDVIKDLGEPNDLDESNAFYDDFTFSYDGGTEIVYSVTVLNGELIMMKTGMTKEGLVGVMGEPQYRSDFLWEYYDTDRMFSVWFDGEKINSINYSVNSEYVADDYDYVEEEPEHLGISEDGLIIWSAEHVSDGDFNYIVGQIENPNSYDIDNVTIEFGIYDQEGNLIETNEDFIRTLVGGATWKYKVMILNEQAYSYKILSVESW